MCKTRWSARAEALRTFKSAFSVIVDVLDQLGQSGDTKCRAYHASVLKFDFIVSLVAMEHVLKLTLGLPNFLQAKGIDLIKASREAASILKILQDERGDNTVFHELFDEAVNIASTFGILPSKPRIAARQIHRVNVEADNPRDYWRRALYLPFMDHITTEIQGLITLQNRYSAQYLVPLYLQLLTDEVVTQIYQEYNSDLNCTHEDFLIEIELW